MGIRIEERGKEKEAKREKGKNCGGLDVEGKEDEMEVGGNSEGGGGEGKEGVGYGKIRIDEKWWRWDEEGEVLKDGRGNKMGQGQGRKEGGVG